MAFRQTFGMSPERHVMFIRQRSACLPMGPKSFNISLWMPSGPGDLCFFSFLNCLLSSDMVKSSSKVDMEALGALSLDFRSCNFYLSSSVSFVDLFMAAKCLLNFSAFFWSSIMVSFSTFIGFGFCRLFSPFRLLRRLHALAPPWAKFRLPVFTAQVFLLAKFMVFLTWAKLY